MVCVVIINKNIMDIIINHANIDPFHECGGYLYGYVKIINGVYQFHIENVYYDKNIKGTENTFNFNLTYGKNAEDLAKKINLELLGTYHSHGQYDVTLSDTDKNVLEKYWAHNKIMFVYSPKYNELYCDFISEDGKTYESPVYIKDKDKYLIFNRFYNNEKDLHR